MNREFLQEAIRLSLEKSQAGEGGPFGAVIVRNGEIVGRGWNRVTSTNDPTAHAEIAAIRDACRRLGTFSLAGCEIYTSCEPCPMCLAAIYWARLERIYYAATRQDAAAIGFDDSRIYKEVALGIDRRAIPMEQALHEEGCAAFHAWLQKADRTPY
jgi:tRNA(Arg) A34 adenosine deaminase TadA